MISDYGRSAFGAGLGSIFGGLFGDSGSPYDAASQQYQHYGQMASNAQQPWWQAGKNAIPDYQNWLNSQKNPSQFINNLMGQYQQSPWAQFQMQQAQRMNDNSASANGLMGSTPYQQAGMDYARNISSQDMNQWLQNVLGINTQYGQGEQNLMQGGQNAANSLSNIYNAQGQNMAEAAYGQKAGQQNDWGNLAGGIGTIASLFL